MKNAVLLEDTVDLHLQKDVVLPALFVMVVEAVLVLTSHPGAIAKLHIEKDIFRLKNVYMLILPIAMMAVYICFHFLLLSVLCRSGTGPKAPMTHS